MYAPLFNDPVIPLKTKQLRQCHVKSFTLFLLNIEILLMIGRGLYEMNTVGVVLYQ